MAEGGCKLVTSDVDVELWKMRKLIKSLDNARGYTINNQMSLEQFEIIELKRNVNLGHDCFFQKWDKYDITDYSTEWTVVHREQNVDRRDGNCSKNQEPS